jgi:hypothetical protein
MKQAYLISSDPLDSLNSVKLAYLISSDSLDFFGFHETVLSNKFLSIRFRETGLSDKFWSVRFLGFREIGLSNKFWSVRFRERGLYNQFWYVRFLEFREGIFPNFYDPLDSLDSVKDVYLISSDPLDSLESVKEAYVISYDPSDSLDSVKEATGFQNCRPRHIRDSGGGIWYGSVFRVGYDCRTAAYCFRDPED